MLNSAESLTPSSSGRWSTSDKNPTFEASPIAHETQSNFSQMNINEVAEADDSIFRTSRFHNRSASVDTGLPDPRVALTKRKLDDYNRTTKDDLSIGNRSRQSSCGGVEATSGPHPALFHTQPSADLPDISPFPIAPSPRRKVQRSRSESDTSASEDDGCWKLGGDDVKSLEQRFVSEEVWVMSKMGQLQWHTVEGETGKRLLFRFDDTIALDGDFGIQLDHVPVLVVTYDANGSKVYMRKESAEVRMYAVRISSDSHPLFRSPQNKAPLRTSYESSAARLPDHFSWIEEVLAVGSVQMRVALYLEQKVASTLLLRPVRDHPVYCDYLLDPVSQQPLRDDQGCPIFRDVCERQLLGVFDKTSYQLLFLLDCLGSNTDPKFNLVCNLVRGKLLRPQIQGEVYQGRVLRLDRSKTPPLWTIPTPLESVCVKVARMSDPLKSQIEVRELASDLRRFGPRLQNPLHSEDLIHDIQTMQFFESLRVPGFLRSLYVAFDAMHLFSATQFHSSGTLYDIFFQRRRPFSLTDTHRIMQFLTQQIQYMHSAGLSHGDIYMDNILIRGNIRLPDADGSIFQECEFVLMDFGQSKTTYPSRPTFVSGNTGCTTPTSTASGGSISLGFDRVPKPQGKFSCYTPESFAIHVLCPTHSLCPQITYLDSLKRLSRRELLEKGDVWQLGVLFFMLLTGKEPISSQSSQRNNQLLSWYQCIMRQSSSSLSSSAPAMSLRNLVDNSREQRSTEEIPSTAWALLERLLHSDPRYRPSFSDLIKDPYFRPNPEC